MCVGGRPAMELYQETMARLDLFTAVGLRVSYVWEHEFIEWQKAAACLQLGASFLVPYFRVCKVGVGLP